MKSNFIFILFLPSLLFTLTFSQTTPIYADSKHFYSAQIVAYLGTGQNMTFALPTAFPISTLTYRQPFIAMTSASHIKNLDNSKLYIWAQF